MMQHLSAYALFVVSAAVLLVVGACQVGGSQAQQSSAPAAGDASGTPPPADSLTLVNQTDSAFVYDAFPPNANRPLRQQIEVDVENPRPEYVSQGDSVALWDCNALTDYENYALHLYRVGAPDDTGTATAHLSKSIRLTSDRLATLQQEEGCRLEVSAW